MQAVTRTHPLITLSMTAFHLFKKYSTHRETRAVALYTVSNFFNKGISFLLLFYFTRVLSEADFGMLSLFSNGMLFLIPFLSLGILQSASTDYFRLNEREFRQFFTSSFVLPALMALLAFVVLALFYPYLTAQFHVPSSFVWMLPLLTWMQFVSELLSVMLRNREEPLRYLKVNAGRLLIELGTAVVLISIWKWGWMARVEGMLLAYLLLTVYALQYFRKAGFFSGPIQAVVWRAELIYSIPVIGFQLAVFFLAASSVYFLQAFSGNLAEVGVYSIAVTFASLINVFCVALLQYVQPKLFGLLSAAQPDYRAIRRQLLLYTGAVVAFTLLACLLVPLVYRYFMKESYQAGLPWFFKLALGQLFWAIAYGCCMFLFYNKQKKKLLLFAVFAAAGSFICNAFMIGTGGASGAASASLLGYSIALVLSFLFVRKQILPILHVR